MPKTARIRQRRFLCIHGHFYQPPRESPWLDEVEVQDSAAPYHDWNARITAECYAPNAAARILDNDQTVMGILNNYAHISFNIGPTLLMWLQKNAPDVAEAMREGDRISRNQHGGHGNALAQPFNHSILPLDSDRDRLTQIRWGTHMFRLFYDREPEGIWLPEAAVDTPTLEALAQEDIHFTILAPHQAAAIRPLGTELWQNVQDQVDSTRPYLCRLPSGKQLTLFFYNGPISRAVAFEGLLNDGAALYQRLCAGFGPEANRSQLVHIATDGESYGHHHRFGEMALAYVIHRALKDPSLQLTNYGEYLALNPPEWEVKIRERTSWSCAHGIERWQSDCGCKTGTHPEWHQKWRKPLRQALVHLRVDLDRIYLREGSRFFSDPWGARDTYIQVITDRTPESYERFWRALGVRAASAPNLENAALLLEMERNGLLMFTSCGWFFDEVSGLETIQILKYAARAIQLAEFFGEYLEDTFLNLLDAVPSNLPEIGHARRVWERFVRPATVDLKRVIAHYAIRSLFHEEQKEEDLHCFRIENFHECMASFGTTRVALGRVRVTSRITLVAMEANFGVIHFGGLDFSCFQKPVSTPEEIDAIQRLIMEAYRNFSVGEVHTMMQEQFPPPVYHLHDLFIEEQRRIIQVVLQGRFQDYTQAFYALAEPDLSTLAYLSVLDFPIPDPMVTVGTAYVNHQIMATLEGLGTDEVGPDKIQGLLKKALPWGFQPDREGWNRFLTVQLEQTLERIASTSGIAPEDLTLALRILAAAESLEISLNLWRAQNLLIRVFQVGPAQWDSCREALETLAQKLRLSKTLLPWDRPQSGLSL